MKIQFKNILILIMLFAIAVFGDNNGGIIPKPNAPSIDTIKSESRESEIDFRTELKILNQLDTNNIENSINAPEGDRSEKMLKRNYHKENKTKRFFKTASIISLLAGVTFMVGSPIYAIIETNKCEGLYGIIVDENKCKDDVKQQLMVGMVGGGALVTLGIIGVVVNK